MPNFRNKLTNMKLSTSQKIEKLNEACKGSVMITYHNKGKWQFGILNVYDSFHHAPTFDAVVDKAFRFVFPLEVKSNPK